MEQKELDKGWMKSIKAPVQLSEMKGVVKNILGPTDVKTEYGIRKLLQFIVEGKEGEVIATEYLPGAFPVIVQGSGLGKIMIRYKCSVLSDMIGKEVELVKGKQDFIKIKKE